MSDTQFTWLDKYASVCLTKFESITGRFHCLTLSDSDDSLTFIHKNYIALHLIHNHSLLVD